MVDVEWVALSLTPRLGGKTFQMLRDHFNGDLSAILAASTKELRSVPRIGPKTTQFIQQINLQAMRHAVTRWQNAGIGICTSDAPDYPAALHRLDDAPPTIFYRGVLPELAGKNAYAIIGTRQPANKSYTYAQTLGQVLARRGQLIVSGLAMGIDAAAHIGTFATSAGITLAVLGNGLLKVYPQENEPIAEGILRRGGALLAEVSPDAPVSASGLVARNRLITGLSDGVIVVETAIDGGAMHAARFARLQGKTIYAVDNHASGNRALLDEGAIALSPEGDFDRFPL